MKFFITGINQGLGKSLALQASRAGHTVYGLVKGAHETAESHNLIKEGITLLECDLSDRESVNEIFNVKQVKSMNPDIVILNAATIEDDFNDVFDEDKMEKIMITNFLSPLKITAAFVNSGLVNECRIVAISSFSAFIATDHHRIGYPSSKAALSMAFSALRLVERAKTVKFITVELGRMAEHNSFGCLAYEKAAKLILRSATKENCPGLVRIPILAAIATKLISLLPTVIQKFLIRKRG